MTAPDTPALARAFIAACRAHGHRPYVAASGRFGIQLSVTAAAAPEEAHHLGSGYAYTLGFDDRPFGALRADPDYVGALIDAAREVFP